MPPSSGSRVAQRAVQLSALALLLGASLAAAGGGGGVAPVFPAPATALAAATPASSSSFSTTSPSSSPSPSSGSDMDPPPPEAEQTERFSSLALFLVLALLILSFWTSYYLKVRKITAVHETIVGLFAGMFIGCVLRLTPGDQVQNMLSFSDTIMLNVLLPPIILASGYDLRQGNFFRNFAVILAFAFAGTFISAIVVGVIVWAWSLLRLEHLPLSLLDCLIFGSTLSATDPVTILAIFKSYKVDPQLYSVIFGESILNDAVSIVMFDTLSKFRGKEIALSSIFHGFGLFIIIFTLSMLLGVCFGLACSLMLKHSNLALYPELESCLVILIAYTSYFFSNSVTMSGIVSLLFCGITLKHYAYHNMSRRTQKTTKYTLSTMASLCENFIFIYLGLSLFTQAELVYKPLFIIVTVIAVVVSRYCAVFPIANVVNFVRRHRKAARTSGLPSLPGSTAEKEELSREYQIMLFWAGLRGAVGFALSAGIEGEHAVALQTTVLVTVVLTVIIFGGTTAQMLEILGIRMGVTDDEDADSDDEEPAFADASVNVRLASATGPPLRQRRSRANFRRSGQYYDDEGETLLTEASPASSNAPGDDAHYPPRLPRDTAEDEEDDQEVLPGHGTAVVRSSYNRHASSPRTATAILGEDSWADAAGEAEGPSALDLTEARSGGATARQLIDRAGLIFRDGQWFQKIDERYLLPMFGNSVAQRKAEDDKARRAASTAGENSSSSSPQKGAWSRAQSRWLAEPGGPLGDGVEPDAQAQVEDDEDNDEGAAPLKTLGKTSWS